MCLSNAYIVRRGKPELVMTDVESVQAVETNVWKLTGLFGEEKRIKARVKSLQLLDNQLLFEELPYQAKKADILESVLNDHCSDPSGQ